MRIGSAKSRLRLNEETLWNRLLPEWINFKLFVLGSEFLRKKP